MKRKEDQLLVQELSRLGLLDNSQVAKLEQFTEKQINRLGVTKLLVYYFQLDESRMAKIISELFDIPFLDDISGISWKDLKGVDRVDIAEKLKLAPIIQTPHELTVASNNPPYKQITDFLHDKTEREITNVVIKTSHFESICAQTGVLKTQQKPLLNEFDELDVIKRGEKWAQHAEQSSKLPPPQKLLEKIIMLAIDADASDIHFDTARKGFLEISYRLDDVIVKIVTLPKFYTTSLLSVLKHHAKLDSLKKGTTQEGQFSLKMNNTDIFARASIIPTSFGENINLRILSKKLNLKSLDELGLTIDALKSFKQLLAIPDGMILFSGPAGCGKTSTMYSALYEYGQASRSVSTVENPIEILIDGVSQTQIKEMDVEFFTHTVRTLFHHDVDVLAMGEVRNLKQLALLIEAGFTGILSCATVQAPNAIQTIYRLANLGVSLKELALVLKGVVSQRFVRKICPHCVKDYRPDLQMLKLAGFENLDANVLLKKGTGCDRCLRTGFLGKIPVFEILVIDEQMSSLIYNQSSNTDIHHAASINGFKSMRYDGLVKALAGFTSLDEVLRVTY